MEKRGRGLFYILFFSLSAFGLLISNGCSHTSSPAINEATNSPIIGEVKLNDVGGFVMSGNDAFILFDGGFYVVDVSSPESPSLVATAEINNYKRVDIAVNGNYLYLTGYTSESGYVTGNYIYVYDISSPKAPKFLNRLSADMNLNICVKNNKLYGVAAYSGLSIYDLSSPEAPSLEVYSQSSWSLDDVDVNGDYIYAADYFNGLKIISSASIETNYQELLFPINEAHRILCSGNYVYVLEYSGKLHIVDITNPQSPVEVSSYGRASDLFIDGNNLYLGSSFAMLDISDKSKPSLLKQTNIIAYHINAKDKYIYVVGNNVFNIIDKTKI